ncbi:hypothetical protein MMC19_005149 [Ptychographa xylographoides]|nr:hypothetical protein [Ptychographa xylographoides]
MGPTTGTTPDMALINELYEEISLRPPALEARKLLIEQYAAVGWTEAAADAAYELLKLDPFDVDAIAFLDTYRSATKTEPSPTPAPVSPSTAKRQLLVTLDPENLDPAKEDLTAGYEALRIRAKALQKQVRVLRDVQLQNGIVSRCDKHIPDLVALAGGRVSSVVRVRPPISARAVARTMEADPDQALDVAVKDLGDMTRWLRSPDNASTLSDNDTVREALAKRVRVLVAALPRKLQPQATTALMHVEHEVLQRAYITNETMYGDPIADIPRSNFWVSEDGYAWDMEELAQALSSNSGVMRNPLSRQLFTPNDIRAIVQHPLGKGLAALHVEQSKMSLGVRPKTIDQLDALAKILLADMSLDQIPSRQAVDDFLAYIATLPQAEQNAISVLRVPAKDSHTHQPFDTSIDEAVRDAQGNRTCFHKTGDFLRQAATYLRKGK